MNGNASTALGVVAAIVMATIGYAALGIRRVAREPGDFMLGGRSFGALFLWILLAGEIYTSFTFLGAAGWAYGKGAPAFYILCYGAVAYSLSFFLLPPIWRIARAKNLLTGPDFFATQYRSKALGGFVALVACVFLVPYVTLQLGGIATLLKIAGYDGINATLTVGVAFAAIALFTFFGGLYGTARASVIKDVLVLAAVLFAGIVLPIRFFGSPANVVQKVMAAHPGWLTLGAPTAANGTVWFVTTVVLTACGFYMFPQSFSATYSARSDDVLRRNAIYLPVYQLMIVLVYFAGFTALLLMPGLKGPDVDQSFMLVVRKYYPPWVVGTVAGAGTLAALVPASGQLLAAASVIAKNVLADYGLVRSPRGQTLATRILVLVVAALAFGFWSIARTTLVGLLLIAYNGVTQFFPGVVLGLDARVRPHPLAAGAGIAAGIATLIVYAATGLTAPLGCNVGLIALLINIAALGVFQLALVRLSRPAVAAAP